MTSTAQKISERIAFHTANGHFEGDLYDQLMVDTTLPPMLGPDDVAELEAVRTATIYKRRQRKQGPRFFRIRREIRVTRPDYFRWLKARFTLETAAE